MSEIKANLASSSNAYIPTKSSLPEKQQSTAVLPGITTDFGLHISAEAQYLFEIDQYLTGLDQQAQDKALTHLAQSNDPLQQKAVTYFRNSQQKLAQIFNGKETLVIETDNNIHQANLLIDAEMPGEPVKGIIFANLFPIFRFDGKEYLNPIEGHGNNDKLRQQLEALTPAISGALDEQDATTLTRIMSTMLRNAEKALVSLDDVIYFTYEIEATKKAIDFYDLPKNLKSALTQMVNDTLIYQDEKQSRFLKDSIPFLNHPEAGGIVRNNFYMGTAAQKYNTQLQDLLKKTNLSVLNAAGPITKLLIQHSELIRFSPNKINEALDFYQKDLDRFTKILNKEFNLPESKFEIDKDILSSGSAYASKVIEQINTNIHHS
jgi:hypothetical protein